MMADNDTGGYSALLGLSGYFHIPLCALVFVLFSLLSASIRFLFGLIRPTSIHTVSPNPFTHQRITVLSAKDLIVCQNQNRQPRERITFVYSAVITVPVKAFFAHRHSFFLVRSQIHRHTWFCLYSASLRGSKPAGSHLPYPTVDPPPPSRSAVPHTDPLIDDILIRGVHSQPHRDIYLYARLDISI